MVYLHVGLLRGSETLEWEVKTENEHNCISIPTIKVLAMDACVAVCGNDGWYDHQGTSNGDFLFGGDLESDGAVATDHTLLGGSGGNPIEMFTILSILKVGLRHL